MRIESVMRRRSTMGACVAALLATPALANVDLELRPVQDTWSVGDTVAIELYAVSDLPGRSDFLFAIEMVFAWDVAAMQLIGLDPTGAADALTSTFPSVGHSGLNEVLPPQDGDGFYLYFAPLASTTEATPDGTLITTFEFEALAESAAAQMAILRSGGDPVTETFVVGENASVITGAIGSTSVTILPACPGDCAPQGGHSTGTVACAEQTDTQEFVGARVIGIDLGGAPESFDRTRLVAGLEEDHTDVEQDGPTLGLQRHGDAWRLTIVV